MTIYTTCALDLTDGMWLRNRDHLKEMRWKKLQDLTYCQRSKSVFCSLRNAQPGYGHSYFQAGPEYRTQCNHKASSCRSYLLQRGGKRTWTKDEEEINTRLKGTLTKQSPWSILKWNLDHFVEQAHVPPLLTPDFEQLHFSSKLLHQISSTRRAHFLSNSPQIQVPPKAFVSCRKQQF